MRRKATLSGLIITIGLKLLKPVRIELEKMIQDIQEDEAREERKKGSIEAEYKRLD